MKKGAKKVTLTASLTVWDWEAEEIRKAAAVVNIASFEGSLQIAFNNGIAQMMDSAARIEDQKANEGLSDDPDDLIPF